MTQQELELPKGWVSDLLTKFFYYVPTGIKNFDGLKDYYSTGSIKSSKITSEGRFNFEQKPSRANRLAKKNDVFQARMEKSEKSLLVNDDFNESLFSTGFLQFRALAGCSPKYLFYLLNSGIFLTQRDKFSTGSTQKALTDSGLKRIVVPLAPLNEQEKIVSKIEELFSKIDSTKKSLEYTKLQLELCRQSLLNAAVSGTIFGNEEKYDQIPLSDVIDSIGQGWSPKCEKIPSLNDKDWAVITTTAIQPMKFDDKQNKKLPQNLEPKLKLELEEDDLLITRAGPRSRVGITCLIKKTRRRLLLCDKAYRIRFKKTLVNPKFFEIILNSPKIVIEINGIKTGTSDSGLNITMKRFSNLIIPLPSIKQQEEIIAKIEQNFSLIANSQNIVNSTLQALETMRMSVLKQAFQGKLVPQDPNDEPASILLEKIKNVQLAQKSKQRRTKNVK